MRRGVLLYLFAIVAPALVLLYLGLQSVERQHQAIGVLAESNRILAAEKLSAALQQRTRQIAEACLREPKSAPPFRTRCALAQHFFIVAGSHAAYPPVQSPPPRDPAGIPPRFREAEAREFRQDAIRTLETGQVREISPAHAPGSTLMFLLLAAVVTIPLGLDLYFSVPEMLERRQRSHGFPRTTARTSFIRR